MTSTWLMTPRPGMDAASKECYELLELSMDGVIQPIRRSRRKSGQLYTVSLKQVTKVPVRIRQVFRTVTPKYGHRLYVKIGQPARNFSLHLDYTDTPISRLHVSDTTSGHTPTTISRNPEQTVGKTISLANTGWLLPKAGYTFTWTLESEMPHDKQSRGKSA